MRPGSGAGPGHTGPCEFQKGIHDIFPSQVGKWAVPGLTVSLPCGPCPRRANTVTARGVSQEPGRGTKVVVLRLRTSSWRFRSYS